MTRVAEINYNKGTRDARTSGYMTKFCKENLMTKSIPLTLGKFAIVDDGDFDWLSQWKWMCVRGYAVRSTGPRKNRKVVFMHRLVANTPANMETDHINGNKLDNQRRNLRVCTRSQNMSNVGAYRNGTSGHKGISWHSERRKWQAYITVNYHRIYLGIFSEISEAIAARDDASKKYQGDFRRTDESC